MSERKGGITIGALHRIERSALVSPNAQDVVNGKLIIVGVPEKPLDVNTLPMILGRRSIVGWPSGTGMDCEDTLKFSVLSGVRPMIETYQLEKAADAYERMMSGKARFRAVITMGK